MDAHVSKREQCIQIINSLDEDLLENVSVMLLSVKNMVDEKLDDASPPYGASAKKP